MPKNKEALRREIEMLAKQTYEPLPEHDMIGRTLHMTKGDAQFFYPDAQKVVQMVKRGSEDGELYYLVYGDGAERKVSVKNVFRYPLVINKAPHQIVSEI